jgi:putative Mg2+ transporter-C (MgtC) family protein
MEHLIDYSNIDICVRLLAAAFLGSLVGLEREITNKYAGLRTNLLVCVGACIFTIISIYGFPVVDVISGQEFGTRNTARVAAQVVTGIGFIGGGTVLRHGANVFGLTTAATLFAVAGIGMACGTGMFMAAGATTLISLIVLIVIGFFEKKIIITSAKNTIRLKIAITCQHEFSNSIYDFVLDKFAKLREISKKQSKQGEDFTKISAIIDINTKDPIKSTYKIFKKVEGIESISIQEYDEIVVNKA